METSLELSRWREKPQGVAYRRWVIASLGIRHLTRLKFFRILLFVGWAIALLVASTAFCFSQAVANGGWLETYAAQLGPRVGAVAQATGALILLYPDICVGGLFTLLFWFQASVAMILTLFALTLIIPGLVTRDRSSNALTIYLSRPLTTGDYLLGKLGTITTVILLLWTGPLLVSWLAAMLLSPSKDFLIYSFSPLLHALLFNLIALAALAPIALGISALVKSSAGTILSWLAAWLILSVIAHAPHSPAILRHASFTYDLDQVRSAVFRPGEALIKAGRDLPMMNKELGSSLERVGRRVESKQTRNSVIGLGVLVLLSSAVSLRKLRPE